MTTTTVTSTRPDLDVTQPEDDLVHEVCIIHEDLAICGEEVPGEEWAGPGDGPDCPLCTLAAQQGVMCAVQGCSGHGRIRWLLHRLCRGRR